MTNQFRYAGLSRDEQSLLAWVSAACGLAWLLIADSEMALAVPVFCMPSQLSLAPLPESLALVMVFTSPLDLAIGWALMVAAMMLPAIYDQLRAIRARSFRSVCRQLTLLYASSYLAVWWLAGAGIVGLALTLRSALPSTYLPLVLTLLGAMIWQASPLKQAALNRCHSRNIISTFASTAFTEAVRAGSWQAVWCIASCWPLMLAAMLVPSHHALVMLALSVWIWGERLEPATRPNWRMRYPVRALRIAARVLEDGIAASTHSSAVLQLNVRRGHADG